MKYDLRNPSSVFKLYKQKRDVNFSKQLYVLRFKLITSFFFFISDNRICFTNIFDEAKLQKNFQRFVFLFYLFIIVIFFFLLFT